MKYKVTALGNGELPDLTETFRYRRHAAKAVKSALKIYKTVKVETSNAQE